MTVTRDSSLSSLNESDDDNKQVDTLLKNRTIILLIVLSVAIILSLVIVVSVLSFNKPQKSATIQRVHTTTPRVTRAGKLPNQLGSCGLSLRSTFDGSFLNPSPRQRINQERIVNGQSASSYSWPWLVSIRLMHKQKLSSHLCGGSLIYNQAVITAAHCVYGYMSGQLAIVVGVQDFNSTSIDSAHVFYVSDFFYHPEFDTKKIVNDIAVLKLHKPVNLSDNVSTICLPISGDPTVVYDKNVIAAGWGSTSGKNKEKDLAQSLQQAVLRIKNGNTICGESEVSKNYCAIGVNMNANACYGDSGSPLMFWDQRWYVFGLTSFILSDNSTCVTGLPSYYTVVPSYLSWIGNVVTAMEIS